DRQISRIHDLRGRTFNVGGGRDVSISLVELTELCAAATGRRVQITPVPETRTADIPLYLTDARLVRRELGRPPARSAAGIVNDAVGWLRGRQEQLVDVFDPSGERRRSAVTGDGRRR